MKNKEINKIKSFLVERYNINIDDIIYNNEHVIAQYANGDRLMIDLNYIYNFETFKKAYSTQSFTKSRIDAMLRLLPMKFNNVFLYPNSINIKGYTIRGEVGAISYYVNNNSVLAQVKCAVVDSITYDELIRVERNELRLCKLKEIGIEK